MNIKRFQQLLEAYGTREENWPREEREAARMLLQSNSDCERLFQQYQQLDGYLDEYVTRIPAGLGEKILSGLPMPLVDRIISWLIPDVKSEIWKPAIAGSLPLVVGVILGTSTLGSLLDATEPTDNWEEEIYLLALDDTANGVEVFDE
ncbi:MAG: hypothetical protein O6945_10180 [Gammaproteobacteria bacterium]|nr:hypothetical protein [Gammaproteobacteria bacterium]